MDFLAGLRGALRRGTPSFNALELAVLAAVQSQLPPDSQRRFQERIRQVNLVQRLDGGREVNCYAMRSGKPYLDPETRIDAAAGEKLLGKFQIAGDQLTANAGAVWLVDGNLFSLEFEKPTEHANASVITGVSVQLV